MRRNALRRYGTILKVNLDENAFETLNVVDHEDRAANFDFEVLRHVEQARFEGR